MVALIRIHAAPCPCRLPRPPFALPRPPFAMCAPCQLPDSCRFCVRSPESTFSGRLPVTFEHCSGGHGLTATPGRKLALRNPNRLVLYPLKSTRYAQEPLCHLHGFVAEAQGGLEGNGTRVLHALGAVSHGRGYGLPLTSGSGLCRLAGIIWRSSKASGPRRCSRTGR